MLDGYRIEIVESINRLALKVGRLLREAKQAAPDEFDAWVVNELPFGLETSRRLMAISSAYEKLPPELLAQMPRPWQALYALKALPVSAIEAGVASGEIHPGLTVQQARQVRRSLSSYRVQPLRSRADEVAGMLMQHPASACGERTRDALRRWLNAATPS